MAELLCLYPEINRGVSGLKKVFSLAVMAQTSLNSRNLGNLSSFPPKQKLNEISGKNGRNSHGP